MEREIIQSTVGKKEFLFSKNLKRKTGGKKIDLFFFFKCVKAFSRHSRNFLSI